MKKIVSAGIILLMITICINSLFFQQEKSVNTVKSTIEPNQLSKHAVPNQKLITLNNKEMTLYDNLGKPTVLVFWASWCIPCNEELPEIQNFYSEYKDSVNVVTINATDTELNIKSLTKYLDDKNWTFPIFIDEKGDIRKTFGAFTVPTTVFLSADGELVHDVYGPIDTNYIIEILSTI